MRVTASSPARTPAVPAAGEASRISAPLDAFNDPAVREVVVKAASPVAGKSQMMNNIIGYFVDQDPSNMMVLHPTVSAAD